MQTEFN